MARFKTLTEAITDEVEKERSLKIMVGRTRKMIASKKKYILIMNYGLKAIINKYVTNTPISDVVAIIITISGYDIRISKSPFIFRSHQTGDNIKLFDKLLKLSSNNNIILTIDDARIVRKE